MTTDSFSPVMGSNANKSRKSVRIMEPNKDSEHRLKQQGKRATVSDFSHCVLTDFRAGLVHQTQSACSPNCLFV